VFVNIFYKGYRLFRHSSYEPSVSLKADLSFGLALPVWAASLKVAHLLRSLVITRAKGSLA
jgi:hypothetical protein